MPLIAFDSAQGAKEIIQNNKNGFIVSNRDKEEFVNKINYIIQNTDIQKLFSENSLIISKTFSKENVSQKWNKFINNIQKNTK